MIDIRRRTTFFFLAVSLGHVLLISAQVQTKSGMPLVEDLAFGAFARVQGVMSGIGDAISSTWRNYFALRGVVAENAALRAELGRLQGQLQAETAISSQTHQLEQMLQLQMTVPQRTLAARVIAGDPAPGALTITIDRGTADGVRANLAVIGPGGVVGRVFGEPQPHAAKVQLLIGRSAAAGAVIPRISAGGVAIGLGVGEDPPMHLQYINKSYEIVAGDTVLTSGQDGIFPAGFLIGTIERAERGGGTTYKLVAIRPAVNFSHLDLVLVVLDPPPSGGAGK
ncbi:MAG: rod shape-determining protein MreC [Acidobacteria bacterium]|nr:MAG: rod shape-determining protein MreC [Acidobacteriota bacterium]